MKKRWTGKTQLSGLAIGAGLLIAAMPLVSSRSTGSVGTSPRDAAELPAVEAVPPFVAGSVTLEDGETLSGMVSRAGLTSQEGQVVINVISGYKDPRRIRPGLTVDWKRMRADSSLYELTIPLNADTTLFVRKADSVWVDSIGVVPVREETDVITGKVTSSFYTALLNAETNSAIPEAERRAVVDVLAERIFAWQIDFSRDLRTDDRFWIIYDRKVRPDGTARSSEVRAVQFMVDGKLHEAYFYEHENGAVGYYDRDGNSLKAMFLRAPVEFRRISSAFNPNRFHPILKRNRPHNGIDYAANRGTPVRATADGRVTIAGPNGGYGNLVELTHTRGMKTRYAHLNGFARGIRAGVRVQQGQIIGYVGSTGLANGPHLHYEVYQNGRVVNPAGIQFRAGEPVPASEKERFSAATSGLVRQLDQERSASSPE